MKTVSAQRNRRNVMANSLQRVDAFGSRGHATRI
jgi:hypothetical protein